MNLLNSMTVTSILLIIHEKNRAISWILEVVPYITGSFLPCSGFKVSVATEWSKHKQAHLASVLVCCFCSTEQHTLPPPSLVFSFHNIRDTFPQNCM